MKIVNAEPVILASQSATRQTLLRNAGIAFEAIAPQLDERGVQHASELRAPGDVALHLAEAKAAEVSARFPARLVIGADQTLALGARLFNKPGDRESAAAQLRSLAGATHELHSAIAVLRNGAVLFRHIAVARMTMRSMTDSEISAYLDAAGDAVTRSVGAYQLEGFGIHLFSRIDGDHFTILGLPLLPLLTYLRSEKLLSF